MISAAKRANCGQHDVVSIDQAAGGTASALYLDDGRRGEGNGIGELIGEGRQKVVCHAAIVTEAQPLEITQMGSPLH
jgi:hypothetical protein